MLSVFGAIVPPSLKPAISGLPYMYERVYQTLLDSFPQIFLFLFFFFFKYKYWYRNCVTMVSLPDVQASNAQIASALPGLVAVFVGATSGIGEYSLKEFARHAQKPRVYFVGRSQEAADRIAEECRELNPDGEFIFIKADVSLLNSVDDVCRRIMEKEKTINLLFLTCGSALSGQGQFLSLSLSLALSHNIHFPC